MTLYKIPLTINTMTSHKDHRLDQLGITSQEEADELQRELGIRFDRFTYHDRKVWNQQNSYLQTHARTRTVSDSADMAGVTVSTAQAWKYLDTLGFTHRLEIADLRFSDSLQVTALERAREPDAPASLLIALLRAHIPEKYSANGHLCDTSKSDELLFHYRQDAQRELAAGHPTLRAIANGTYQPPSQRNLSPADTPSVGAGFKPAHDLSPAGEETQRGGSFPTTQYDSEETTPHDDIPPIDHEEIAHFDLSPTENDTTHPDLSPTDQEPVEAGFKPALVPSPTTEETTHPDLSPTDQAPVGAGFKPTPVPSPTMEDTAHPNLSPNEGETQRGGAPTPNDASDLSPTDQAPVEAGFKPALVPSPTTEETQRGGTPQHPAPSTQHPVPSLTRRQRRELQRKHKRKRQKSHRPRAPN